MTEDTPTSPISKAFTFFTGTSNKAPEQVVRANIVPINAQAKITTPLEAVEGFPICALLTKPIFSDKIDNYIVRNVEFLIESNDQGWSNEDNFEGEYEGSQTWFEVAILRPLIKNEDPNISSRDKRNINLEPCIKQFLDEENITDTLRFIINDNSGTPFWYLQTNQRGKGEPYPHTVKWNRDSEQSASERLGWDFNPKTGAGSGVDFVRCLQSGHRIVVIARATQSGSVNYVSKAMVDIYLEEVGPANNTPTGGLLKALPTSGQEKLSAQSKTSKSLTVRTVDDSTLGRPDSISILGPSSAKAGDASMNANRTLLYRDEQAELSPLHGSPNVSNLSGNSGTPAPSKTPANPDPPSVGETAQKLPQTDQGTQRALDDSSLRTQQNPPANDGRLRRLKTWANNSLLKRSRTIINSPGNVKQVGGEEAGGRKFDSSLG